ncbi:MAG TPA: adenylate kinase family protein [Candidatus Thermoplasmatota archaeon]|nr:adenylate kinase family protein [Candidatus Thermoplasmatota archaeon]
MRRYALTGVPGTGKTTLAEALARRGDVAVVHLNEFARERGLLREKDESRGSYLVDMDELADALHEALEGRDDAAVVVEGHFAHEMDVDAVILLRCDPLVLYERLRARGWPEAKVRENVEAEALDVLAQEVLDTELPAVELDVSRLPVEEATAALSRFAETPPKALKGERVGSAAWRVEQLPWF